jgi:non-ribosomal peptide synthetase component F
MVFDSIDSSIPARFEQIAMLYPQRVAIGSGTWQPTYAELNAAADSFASDLRARRGPGGRVALLQRLDGFLIGSILGVLKAGQVVAVLNAADPLPRLRQSLLEVEPWIIVAEPATRELATQVAPPEVPVAIFREPFPIHASGPVSTPQTSNGPEDLAFLIQTSGSTGRSKRVMQTQRGVMAQADHHNAEMRIQPDDRILLLASPTGSHATASILCALLYGAAISPFPVAEKGIIGLGEWIRRHNITVYVSAASAFRQFLKTLQPNERFPLVRLVRLGSEAILGADLRAPAEHFREDCIYYCSYNCAEAGNIMQKRISPGDSISGFRVPLGNPAADTEVLLCDEGGLPVANGEVGEIVVRSKFLSPGYWRDERLTVERFTAAAADGTRSYRTGDLGRREPDGTLSYVGRRDDMVKIRGNRVILGEVEQNMRSLADVQEAVVLARTLADGSVRLAAFVVVRTGAPRSVATIRSGLSALLPNYMVPGEFAFLDRLPLNSNGKIDSGALLARAASDAAPLAPDGFATHTEALLSRIWTEAFGQPASRRTDFFDSGGDSLTAGVVAAKVHAAFGVNLDMHDFAENPHFSDLAVAIDRLRDEEIAPGLPPIGRALRRSHHPLSFAQEAIWRHCHRSAEDHRSYTASRSYGLCGPLDVEALREAMTRVAASNEILRTTFPSVNGNPVQAVHPAERVALPLIDFSGQPDPRARGVAQLREEALRPLDLERGPVLRYALVRIAPEEHWLLRVSHQILADGWSAKVYFQELESAYESILKSGPPSLESSSLKSGGLQYGDYAVWERNVFPPGSKFRSQLDAWWKSTLANQPASLKMPFRRHSIFQRLSRRGPKPSEGWLWSALDPAIGVRLGDLARRESTTHFTVGVAAFAALLAVVTRRNKVMVGIHVTNRASVALQSIQGNFARMVPLCLEHRRTGTFLEWLSTVRKQVVEVQAHAQLPREELWADLRSQGVNPPEIEVIFGGRSVALPAKFGGLELTEHSHRFKGLALEEHPAAAMPWGFTLNFNLNNEERPCELTFDARIYDPPKVRSFLHSYLRLLEELSLAPDQPLDRALRRCL